MNNSPEGNLSQLLVSSSHNYNLGCRSELRFPKINTVFKGQNSISCLGSAI